MLETLEIFDFDGTLFRSPSPPSDWERGWWGNPDSLLPPFVPEQVVGKVVPESGKPWWNTKLLDRLSYLEDRGAEPWVVTGRPERRLRPRLEEFFSEVGLSSLINGRRLKLSTGRTEAFKLKTFRRAAEERAQRVENVTLTIYDDREEHFDSFEALIDDLISEGVVLPDSRLVKIPSIF
jgi:hypothetical protein